MGADHLIDGHFVFFKVEIGHALAEDADEEVVGELILVGEAGGGDGLDASQEASVDFVALGNGCEGNVVELVVVAIVAVVRGAFGIVAEVRFVLFVEQGVLGGDPVGDGLGV